MPVNDHQADNRQAEPEQASRCPVQARQKAPAPPHVFVRPGVAEAAFAGSGFGI
jgi:hypothetical protein